MNYAGFGDIFKKGFLENFSGDISTVQICITLGYAFVLSFIVYMIYKITSRKAIYSRVFNVTMALMSIVTAAVVLSMQSNIVVSLGMVGALSIVRFRTAIKEPRDLLFLFWSISNGIIIGAQVYEIALILTIVLSCAMIFYDVLPEKKMPYLLVVKADSDVSNILEKEFIGRKIRFRLKSRNVSKYNVTIIYELFCQNYFDTSWLIALDNIEDVNFLTCDGEA